jgi:CubicO group peptidase (beta-lactamase class C family)
VENVTIEIQGVVEPGFEAVREAFGTNFAEHAEVGAACCIVVDGRVVVDIWGGLADPDTGRAWERDTLQLVFSATKGATAICANRLVEEGSLDLDAPVAHYWPEFAARGKQDIPVRWVLGHKAGLASVEGDLTLSQVLAWDPVVEAIAAQAPNWEPGTSHGYHARSYGWVVGELVRRICGRTLGRYFAEEVADPLGLQFRIGLPREEHARCARTIPPDAGSKSLAEILGADSLTAKVLSGPSNLFAYDDMWNRPELLEAEMPSSNGVCDARSLARMYSATLAELDGVRLLAPETRERARAVESEGPDKVILLPTRFGLGFALSPMLAPGCGEQCYGHPGAGGSLGFADPESGLAFGYVMNKMMLGLTVDKRGASLVDAAYRCLGG